MAAASNHSTFQVALITDVPVTGTAAFAGLGVTFSTLARALQGMTLSVINASVKENLAAEAKRSFDAQDGINLILRLVI